MWKRRRARTDGGDSATAFVFRVVTHLTVATGEKPALMVIHDNDDDWLVLDRVDAPSDAADFLLCGADALLGRDPTLREAFVNLPMGYCLVRERLGGLWTARRLTEPDDEPEP